MQKITFDLMKGNLSPKRNLGKPTSYTIIHCIIINYTKRQKYRFFESFFLFLFSTQFTWHFEPRVFSPHANIGKLIQAHTRETHQ